MTYKEKAVEIIMDKLQVQNRWEAIDIVNGISEYGEYKPCVLGVLNAPEDVKDWNQNIHISGDAGEQGLLLQDKLIHALAEKVLNSEFGRCYMCTNPMKNITLDGVNNGCDGNCGHKEFTTDDLIKKVVEEIQFKSESNQKLKEVTVCLEALFNRLKEQEEQDTDDYVATSYGHIQKESDGNKEWFDFINDTLPYEGRACMDGETCEIIEETEEYILLQEIDEQIPFKLSKDEFEFSTMLCR